MTDTRNTGAAASRPHSAISPQRRSWARRATVLVAAVAAAGLLAACGTGSNGNTPPKATAQSTATPKAGGDFTMLEQAGLTGNWPTGLDPATNTTGGSNLSIMSAVYGNVFELGQDGKTIPSLASGYDISSDGLTVTVHMRPNVKFSDGTPVNAAAVKFNWDRDLASTVGSNPHWPSSGITTSGDLDVVIHLTRVFAPIINSFHAANVNWLASPTALQSMGEDAFKLMPVGAGPFTVTKDVVSTELDVKKNPSFWDAPRPYLDTVKFVSVAGDEGALEAMRAGQGDGYEGMQTPQLVKQFQQDFAVLDVPSTSPYVIQLNTSIAPFNNKAARDAIYYATDVTTIDTKLFGSLHPVTQGFTSPEGLFYEPKVPGYKTFDLAKAKDAVKQAGGVTVNVIAAQSSVTQTVLEALQTQWQAAGMTVNIKVEPLPSVIADFGGKQWQAALQTSGSFDPAAGIGVTFRFGSTAQYSGVHDPALDELLAKAAGTLDQTQRKTFYDQAAKYISDNSYAPFMFPVNGWNIAKKGVSGQGLTTLLPAAAVRPEILWETVGFTK